MDRGVTEIGKKDGQGGRKKYEEQRGGREYKRVSKLEKGGKVDIIESIK